MEGYRDGVAVLFVSRRGHRMTSLPITPGSILEAEWNGN